ncbi:SH3 domain-containing protein [Mesorhizobium sp. VNQ89]|uniref:SH3 domain-containing protein n=1 Tax=Mesorhizobium quangtriensis TaxID=3157709 RepID=UPI0032B712A1
MLLTVDKEEVVFVRFCSVALALFLGLTVSAGAQVPQSAQTTTNLNMRSGPGTQHAIIGNIPKDTWLQVHGCTDPIRWCQTVFNNIPAWVSANYLHPRPIVIGQSPAPPPPPPPPSAGPVPPADIPLFGPGFRTPEDLCRRAGESAFTNQFLGGGFDLVACPPGTDSRLFAFETGGKEVARRDGWMLFTVPQR